MSRRRRQRYTTPFKTARNAAFGQLARATHWFRPTTQFIVGFLLLTTATTFLLARSRTQLPADYREGDIVTANVVSPTDIQVEDPAATDVERAADPAATPVLAQLKRNQIVA